MSAYSYLFKYIVIGDTGVGKSCLVLQFIDNRVRDNHDITIGVEFGAKIVQHENTNIKLQIWDTAGQENFRSITRSYYRSAAAALLVYDITREQSFTNLKTWMEEVKSNGNPKMTILLVGNKNDLTTERAVTYQQGLEFANQYEMDFIETSAKTSDNVDEAFKKTTNTIYQKIKNKDIDLLNDSCGIKLGSEFKQNNIQDDKMTLDKQKKKKEGCC